LPRVRSLSTGSVSLLAVVLSSCGGEAPPPVAPAAPAAPVSAAPSSSAAPAPSSVPASAPPIAEDEGMWLLEDFPSERVGKAHGFTPTQAWLDHVRLSSIRLAGGCSASLVSPDGLVMTNHHCAHKCIEQLSTPKKDYIATGFYAKTPADEVKCPEIEANQLVKITDVTSQVAGATAGLSGKAFNDAQREAMSRIEKECAGGSDEKRCDVVSLYHGGQYHLYEYRRFQDVRLVFAPELAIAFFGGDPDNFNFPRYDLDVSFLRIWNGDAPAKTPDHFAWSEKGAAEGDLTFVSGHPGSTSRELTIAELDYIRDVALPSRLFRLSEARGVLEQFRRQGAEARRVSSATFFSVENALKALKGRHAALLSPTLMDAKVAREKELRARIAADPELAAKVGDAFEQIERAEQKLREIRQPYGWIEQGSGFWSQLFGYARTLVRAGDELPKPNGERLRELGDSRLPQLKQGLFSTAPVHADLEVLTLSLSLRQLREELGPDDPFVRKVLGKKSPDELARELVKGTKLADPKVRKALFEGGKAAVDASKDPMIELARLVDPDARAVRKRYEDEVEAVVKQASEKIAKARFAAYGTSVYPDATFTLRLSFGVVKGWMEHGRAVSPVTTLAGAFERATGREPFALPKSWLAAKPRLDLATPLDFATTNDIIGGNSGSPVVNRDAEVVGLIFDGNIHSLGGDYAYDPTDNRAVAVESTAIAEALGKIYGAGRIQSELLGTRPKR
jgi:hypothetical protein